MGKSPIHLFASLPIPNLFRLKCQFKENPKYVSNYPLEDSQKTHIKYLQFYFAKFSVKLDKHIHQAAKKALTNVK